MQDARPAVITLRISEAGDAAQRAFTCHVLLDGEVVAASQALSPAGSRAIRQLAHSYGALFEGARAPHLAAQALSGLGTNLFQTWLGSSWEPLAARLPFGAPRLLVVASGAPDILNLPWELLRPPGEEFMGADARWSVRRLPWSDRSLAPFVIRKGVFAHDGWPLHQQFNKPLWFSEVHRINVQGYTSWKAADPPLMLRAALEGVR